MKNNRPIEVGQVRMIGTAGSPDEGNLYVIKKKFCDGSGMVTWIDGTYKGEEEYFESHEFEDDIVVM